MLTRLHLIQSWLGGAPGPAPAVELPLLLPDARGRDVVEMKRKLKEWYAAHPPPLAFNDGPVYGPAAVEAVKEFQRRNKLLDDGKVGQGTWAALRGEVKTPTSPARQVPPAPAHVSFPNTLYPRKNTWNGLQPWLVPQVKAICERFKLTVTAGWSDDTAHATRSDHRWGGAVDLVGSAKDMIACTFWADEYTSAVYKPGNGVPLGRRPGAGQGRHRAGPPRPRPPLVVPRGPRHVDLHDEGVRGLAMRRVRRRSAPPDAGPRCGAIRRAYAARRRRRRPRASTSSW